MGGPLPAARACVCQKNRAGCGIPEGGGEDFASPQPRQHSVSQPRSFVLVRTSEMRFDTTALRGTPNTWQANVEKHFKASTSLQKLLTSAHFARTLIKANPRKGNTAGLPSPYAKT